MIVAYRLPSRRTAARCRAGRASARRQGIRRHAEHPHLGDGRFEHRQQHAADRELGDDRSAAPTSKPTGALAPAGDAPGQRTGRRSARCRAAASAMAAASISARWRPEYSSTMASCTMVSSRWVAGLSIGNARVLGDGDDDQRDQRQAERDPQADAAAES